MFASFIYSKITDMSAQLLFSSANLLATFRASEESTLEYVHKSVAFTNIQNTVKCRV